MIIYEANETDFFSNGLGTLPDATSALVTEERNGEFVLDVIYPQQGLRSELLTKNRIIKADAGHELKDQRFVIKKVTPTMDSDGYIYLTVHAEHVSYITADLGVTPNLTLSGNATQALEQWRANLVGGHPDITVDSDIVSEYETSLDITKATNARQVLGGVEGSILDTWGGEYKFDNLHISLRGQRGTTANTLISYGRNLLTFEQEDDITDTYTSIYPYANVGLADGNNSKLITVDGYFVDSQYVDRYPNRKLLPVDFGSEFTDYKIGSKPSESDTGIYTTEAEIKKKLTELAKQYIENNRVGIPKVSTKITFADLSKTSEYAPLEQVNLCDIIPIRFEKLGIDTTIKVTRVVWNVLLDEYDSIELGDLRTTLGESISALESKTTGLANAVITAQSTADNQNSIFRTNGGTAEPVAKKTGDLWFKTDGDYQYMYQWDGAVWHEVVNTKTTDDIAKEVDKAKADAKVLSSEVESAKKQAQEAFAKAGFNADEISNVKTATSEVTETLTSTVRQASELSESLKNVASETASRYSEVSSELSGARNSLTAKASELAKEVASNSANITKANSQLYSQSEGLAKVSQSATKMEQTMTDLSGRVHTVETTAGETKESLADAKGNITTLTKRADGTDTKIADAQGRVQTLESRAGKWDLELSKKVDNTTYNAGIQNLGNQINLKANKSDLNGYATKAQLSVESDRITQQASAISSVTTIANGANSKIDNLSFGGRNLIDRSDGQFVMGYGITNTTWENGKAVLRYNSADVSRNSEILPQNAAFGLQFPVARGEQLTQSIYLDTDANINFNNNFEFSWFDYKDGHKFVRANIDKIGQNTYRLWGSYTWDKNSSNLRIMDIANLYKVVNFRNSGTYLAFYHPQIEKASRPSDYSLSQNDLQRLASEDTASQINQYNTGTVQPIKGIANDALGKANNANNKIDGLRIGGRNLLKGTSDQFKTLSNSGWMWAHTYSNYPFVDLSNFHTGDYLTYSVWVHNTSDVPVRAEIYCFDKNKGHTHIATNYNNVINPGNSNWLVITMPIESNDWYARPSVITTSGQTGSHTIEMREEMLTLGNVRLPWQPSDLDLPNTIVSTVTTTTNAKQIVDSSGIYSEVTKLVDTKVGNVTTQLDSYKHTVDDTGNKLRDVMGALKLDSNGKLTSNFNELIKTASGVEERYTQLNGKIDGIVVGGKNLINNSGNPQTTDGWTIRGANPSHRFIVNRHNFWKNAQETLFTLFNSNSSEVRMSSDRVKVERNTEYTLSYWSFEDSNVVSSDTFFLGRKNGNTSDYTVINKLVDSRVYSTTKAEYVTLTFNTGDCDEGYIRFDNNGTRNVGHEGGLYLANIQLEKGNKPSDWGMSDNDINRKISDANASIAKTNETIKTVDGNVTTVKNNLDKTKSVVTQLANLFDVNVGDSSISVTNGGVLVKGKQVHIDGQTVIDNASIDGAKIKSLDAGKITTGTLNAAAVKVINLDANNIKTGTLTGPGMALDLNNGSFKINNSDNSLKAEMDSGKLRFYRLNGKLMGEISASDWTGVSDDNQALKLSGKSGAVLKTENFKMTNFMMSNGAIFTTSDAPSSNGSAVILRNNDVRIIGQTDSKSGFPNSRIDILAGKPTTYKDSLNLNNVSYTGMEILGDEQGAGIVNINSRGSTHISANDNKLSLDLTPNSITADVGNNRNYNDATRRGIFDVYDSSVMFKFKKDNNFLTPMTVSNDNTVYISNLMVPGDLSVFGDKNNIVQTTAGWTKINAYETAEYYFGDLGTAVTDDTSTVRIGIEPLFNETVNTDIPYQVFITSYGEGYAWVAERGSNYFVIKSSVPNLEIGYEIKAKRKGYENVRLEIDKHMEANK